MKTYISITKVYNALIRDGFGMAEIMEILEALKNANNIEIIEE